MEPDTLGGPVVSESTRVERKIGISARMPLDRKGSSPKLTVHLESAISSLRLRVQIAK